MGNGEAGPTGARRIDRASWLAYLAGYLDGEGCFVASPRSGVRVSVSNCFPWTLRALQEEFGGAVRVSCQASDKKRVQYQWQASGSNAVGCIQAVIPYLIEKAPQAALVLEYRNWPVGSAKRRSIERELKRLKRTNYE
jgi:hypothetical protein